MTIEQAIRKERSFQDTLSAVAMETLSSLLRTHYNIRIGFYVSKNVNGDARLHFVTPREIDSLYNKKPDNTKIIEKLKVLLEAFERQCNGSGLEDILWQLRRLIEEPEEYEEGEGTDRYLKVKELAELLKELVFNRELPSRLEGLAIKLIKLLAKLTFRSYPLGLYIHSERTIFLCLERIERAADYDFDHGMALVKAVYVHEFTHYVHMCSMDLSRRSRSTSPVLETIAATVEYEYAKNTGDSWLINWVAHSITAGLFPGWPYAGAAIMENLLDSKDYFDGRIMFNENELNREWFNVVFSTSLVSCPKAHGIIDTLDRLRHFDPLA